MRASLQPLSSAPWSLASVLALASVLGGQCLTVTDPGIAGSSRARVNAVLQQLSCLGSGSVLSHLLGDHRTA